MQLFFSTDSKGMLNGQSQRVRERIPTPENDNRLNSHHINNSNNNPFSAIHSIATGVAWSAQNLATNPSIFPNSSSNVQPAVSLLLSPIKESDSVNNTLSNLSSSSLAPSMSTLPINMNSNAQFVIPNNSHQDMDTSSKPFIVMRNENEMIPVSVISTVPSMSNQSTSGAIITDITDLPFDQPDSSRIPPGTPSLVNLLADSLTKSPGGKHKIQRQHSVESNEASISNNADNVSSSPGSTLSKRPKKHNEVYV